jgi:hypothetical protein
LLPKQLIAVGGARRRRDAVALEGSWFGSAAMVAGLEYHPTCPNRTFAIDIISRNILVVVFQKS